MTLIIVAIAVSVAAKTHFKIKGFLYHQWRRNGLSRHLFVAATQKRFVCRLPQNHVLSVSSHERVAAMIHWKQALTLSVFLSHKHAVHMNSLFPKFAITLIPLHFFCSCSFCTLFFLDSVRFCAKDFTVCILN